MRLDFHSRRQQIVLASAIFLLTGTILTWALTSENPSEAPQPFTVEEARTILNDEQLAAMNAKDRKQKLEEYGARLGASDREVQTELMRDEALREKVRDMPEKDRNAFRTGMMKIMIARYLPEVKKFCAATPEEQDTMLDARITEMQAMVETARKARAEREARDGKDRPHREFTREQREGMMRQILEAVQPADRAMVQEYMRRLQERAREQGIEMRGPGGRH